MCGREPLQGRSVAGRLPRECREVSVRAGVCGGVAGGSRALVLRGRRVPRNAGRRGFLLVVIAAARTSWWCRRPWGAVGGDHGRRVGGCVTWRSPVGLWWCGRGDQCGGCGGGCVPRNAHTGRVAGEHGVPRNAVEAGPRSGTPAPCPAHRLRPVCAEGGTGARSQERCARRRRGGIGPVSPLPTDGRPSRIGCEGGDRRESHTTVSGTTVRYDRRRSRADGRRECDVRVGRGTVAVRSW